MSRGTYLQRIARRAIQDTPGLLHPRRLVRGKPATTPDDAESVAPAPTADSSRMLAVDPVEPRVTGPVGPSLPPSARPELAPQQAEHFPAVASARLPDADGANTAVPRRDVPSAPRVAAQTSPAHPIERPSRMESPAIDSDRGTEPIARAPGGTRRPLQPRHNVPVAPDSIAIALAAALSWTSSGERPDRIAGTRSEREPHAREAAREDEPLAGPARKMLPHDPPARAPRAPRAEGVAATRRGPLSPAPPATPARPVTPATPAPAANRFTGIHIGSLEVQILPPPEVVAPPIQRRTVANRVAGSAAPAAPLARGLTSAIGLRQS